MGDRYEFPVGFGMAPSPWSERVIPVNNLPASDPEMARLTYDVKHEPLRQERIQQLIDEGVQKDVAALRATKEFELDRPTISADAVREVYPYYEGDQPVSPSQFLKEVTAMQSIAMSMSGRNAPSLQEAYDHAVAMVTGTSTGGDWTANSTNEIATSARNALLDVLQRHAPQGDLSDKSGISETDFNALQAKHGDAANFMYPDKVQPNFDALRQYELFTAGTNRHEPSSEAGIALRGMGGIFRGMHKEGAQDFANAVDMAVSPREESVARDAMRWYESSRPDRDFDGFQSYRQPNNDAKFWTHSTTTPTGLGGAMGEDTSRRMGRWSAHTLPYTQDPSVSGEAKSFLGQVRADTNRPVSIIRLGFTPETTQQYHEAAKEYGDKSDAYLSAQFAKATGAYPTPFADSSINMFRNLGDPGTLASMAFGAGGGAVAGARGAKTLIPAIRSIAGGFGRGLGAAATEEALEGPLTNMVAMPAFGYSAQEAFINSPKENALAVRNGWVDEVKDLHPTHPKFGKTVDRNMRQAKQELESQARQYNRRRRSPLQGLQ